MSRRKGQKDTKPRQTPARKLAAAAEGEGLTPLQYMLSRLRASDATPEEKRWAAEKAAPYMHPRLATVEHKPPGDDGAFRIIIDRVD